MRKREEGKTQHSGSQVMEEEAACKIVQKQDSRESEHLRQQPKGEIPLMTLQRMSVRHTRSVCRRICRWISSGKARKLKGLR